MAKKILKQKDVIKIRKLFNKYAGVPVTKRTSKRDVVYMRSIFAVIMADTYLLSYVGIGNVLNKHHTSITHYINNTYPLIEFEYKEIKEQIEDELKGITISDKVEELQMQIIKEKEKMDALKNKRYTPNEIAYRELSEENQRKYDVRADAIIKMLKATERM